MSSSTPTTNSWLDLEPAYAEHIGRIGLYASWGMTLLDAGLTTWGIFQFLTMLLPGRTLQGWAMLLYGAIRIAIGVIVSTGMWYIIKHTIINVSPYNPMRNASDSAKTQLKMRDFISLVHDFWFLLATGVSLAMNWLGFIEGAKLVGYVQRWTLTNLDMNAIVIPMAALVLSFLLYGMANFGDLLAQHFTYYGKYRRHQEKAIYGSHSMPALPPAVHSTNNGNNSNNKH